MAEYLDKNKLIDNMTEEIAEYILTDAKPDELVIRIANCIKSYIAMQAGITDKQFVKRGYWKDIMMSEATGWDLSLTGGRDAVCETVCSVCGDCCAFGGDGELYLSPYCPNCGADMRGDTND